MKIKKVTEGIYLLPLGNVNAYLLSIQNGLVLIDTGVKGSGAKIIQAVQSLGYTAGDITTILLTHLLQQRRIHMKRKALMLLVLFIMLAGCSSSGYQADTFSIKDIAFQKVNNENEQVSYGMKREEVEKVLGDGADEMMNYTFYDNGVNVFYRDGKLVAFYLGEKCL